LQTRERINKAKSAHRRDVRLTDAVASNWNANNDKQNYDDDDYDNSNAESSSLFRLSAADWSFIHYYPCLRYVDGV